MKNPITTFKAITALKEKNTYTTNSAIGYFRTKQHVLDTIADDIIETETDAPTLTPGNLEKSMSMFQNISSLEKFLETTNKNNKDQAEKIIDIEDILIKFEIIKRMMLHTNEKLRADGYQLFIRTAELYSSEEIQEFVSWLNEHETYNIVGMLNAENYLIDKQLTGTPMQYYINEKMKLLQQRTLQTEDLKISEKQLDFE